MQSRNQQHGVTFLKEKKNNIEWTNKHMYQQATTEKEMLITYRVVVDFFRKVC